MHSYFTMTFPSFQFTTLTHHSHPHHSLLPFTSTSLHFTSLHFTSLHFWMISPTNSLRLIYQFPNPFPKTASFSTPQRLGQPWCPHSILSNGYGGAYLLGIKWPGRETDHSPQSSAEVKNDESTSIPPVPIRFNDN
jgi:hypothetical protein